MPFLAHLQLRRVYRIIAAFTIFVALLLFLRPSFKGIPYQHTNLVTAGSASGPTKTFVIPSLEEDDVSWIHEYLPDWDVARYVVDNPSANLTVPKNKGQEAMAYLTYIIDTYDNLPDVMVFMHSSRYQWHNDDPFYDGVPLLKNLQLSYVVSQSYVNLRCVWTLGCPAELNFNGQPADSSKTTEAAYPDAFKELFPGESLPPTIGVACCAQFAVTREKIRERPIQDYKRYRQWLSETPLDNYISGRILEYSWHIIFGQPPVHCPNAQECYCKTFGLCTLECKEDGKCGEYWPFPPFSSLPKGWPTVDWDGQNRNAETLVELRNKSSPLEWHP